MVFRSLSATFEKLFPGSSQELLFKESAPHYIFDLFKKSFKYNKEIKLKKFEEKINNNMVVHYNILHDFKTGGRNQCNKTVVNITPE